MNTTRYYSSTTTGGETLYWARTLEPRHTEHCRLFPSRDLMLEQLPKRGVVAEIGTDRGSFARKILKTARPSRLHIIDLDFSRFDRSVEAEAAAAGIATQLHPGDSATVLGSFPDHTFDWIYIDGDHTFEGVCRDIRQAVTKVKPDGLLVFNDYTVWSAIDNCAYGVMRAVHDLCLDEDFELVFLALSGCGYHDVALRRRTKPSAG